MPEWAGMAKVSETSALIIILLIAFSSLTVLTAKPANTQTMPADHAQTVTIDQIVPPSWSSPTCESPALPAWYWLIGLSFLVAAILIAAVLRYRETKH